MLDDLIRERTQAQDYNRRIAVNVQRIARLVAIPAAALMLLGLIAFDAGANGGGRLLDQSVVPLRSLFTRPTVSPVGAMSVGLLALALLPVISVWYILIDSLSHRRYSDAAAAAAVAAVLLVGIFLGRA